MEIFDSLESNVRSYIRSFPTVFDRAKGSIICDQNGDEYIDFLAGAGSLNYGHNNRIVSEALISYLQRDGIVHSLDKGTKAKENFLRDFSELILAPRGYDYKIQFTGPTGTNAVEAALKLARLVTGRENVIAFTNGYHGLTMGALATTGNAHYHRGLSGTRNGVTRMPFDGYLGEGVNTADYLEKVLDDSGSGVDLPAAILLETVQGEGGINVARDSWLQQIAAICEKREILLIVDDIQVGNGRTGQFFSFENAGIRPDIVCISKSIGSGLPMSILLLNPEVDQWQPGQHTGTFRGNNLGFVAASAILRAYWSDDMLTQDVLRKGAIIEEHLQDWAVEYPQLDLGVRGRGFVWGIEVPDNGLAGQVSRFSFENNLIIETCGSTGSVVKLLPPLTIEDDVLARGLQTLGNSFARVATM